MKRLLVGLALVVAIACSRDLAEIIGMSDDCREDDDCQAGAYLVCQKTTGRCVLSEQAVDNDGDGWTEVAGDCDDTDARVAPTVIDLCDALGVDDDCDGDPNNTDRDRDGFIDAACGGDDCDDGNPAISPLAVERCGDSDDQNCDGDPDNRDFDRDSYIDTACGGDDCDDRSPNVYPGASEICDDGIDQSCGPETPLAYNGASNDRLCPDQVDDDGDGLSEQAGDCADDDRRTYPGASELCDFADNDCSGLADENLGDECPHFDYGGADYTWGSPTPFAWDDARPTNPNAPLPFGDHFNIGVLTVPAGTTIAVRPVEAGSELKGYGSLTLDARRIIVLGAIDGTGAGPGGGGGGGGGGAPNSPGNGGSGTGGGSAGTAGSVGNPNFTEGGPGGRGGGAFGGNGGLINQTSGAVAGNCQDGLSGFGAAGGRGGYLAAGANGDISTGPDVALGSGGGGGGGGDGIYNYAELCPGVRRGGGGGGAGNRGGGRLVVRALDEVVLGPQARIRASGRYCAAGGGANSGETNGGGGGSAANAGTSAGGSAGCNICGAGGRGGAGSGGGVLVSSALGPVTVQTEGAEAPRIESLSGADNCTPSTTAGGTVKIFAGVVPSGGFSTLVSNVSAGRFCAGATGEACVNVP